MNNYLNITEVFSKYKRKKDWESIAEKYAKKNGETAEYWLAKWERNKEESRKLGDLYHKLRFKKEGGTSEVDDLSKLTPGEYHNVEVYSHYYKVRGRVDFMRVTEQGITLRNFTTSESLDTTSTAYYDSKTRRREVEKYLPPLTHLSRYTLNDLTIQVSMLAHILETYGYTISRLVVEHVELEGREKGFEYMVNNLKSTRNEDHVIDYLEDEAIAVLKHNKHVSRDI